MGIASKYVSEVRKQTAMTAIYPPNSALHLGDYGRWEDDIFYPEGNVADFQIPYESIVGSAELRREFKSSSVIKTAFAANAAGTVGGVANVKARLELEFGSEFGIFVAVTGCLQSRIKDITTVGQKVMALRKAKKWDDHWKVVTALVSAKNLTVITSQQRNAKIVLEAKGDVPQIDLAEIGLSLSVVLDKTSSEHWITEKPEDNGVFTPFCSLHGVGWGWGVGHPVWKPQARRFLLAATSGGAAFAPDDMADFIEYRGEDVDWEPM